MLLSQRQQSRFAANSSYSCFWLNGRNIVMWSISGLVQRAPNCAGAKRSIFAVRPHQKNGSGKARKWLATFKLLFFTVSFSVSPSNWYPSSDEFDYISGRLHFRTNAGRLQEKVSAVRRTVTMNRTKEDTIGWHMAVDTDRVLSFSVSDSFRPILGCFDLVFTRFILMNAVLIMSWIPNATLLLSFAPKSWPDCY